MSYSESTSIYQNFKTTSSQGDGNCGATNLGNALRKRKFQNHIPARGRKQDILTEFQSRMDLFQNHIPARGRKLHKPRRSFELFRFQNHIPARGRKLLRIRFARAFLIVNFKTTSPQGDGNNSFDIHIDHSFHISKPHPRKGTETSSSQNSKMVFTSDFKTTSP